MLLSTRRKLRSGRNKLDLPVGLMKNQFGGTMPFLIPIEPFLFSGYVLN
jgi:hypothetical protein